MIVESVQSNCDCGDPYCVDYVAPIAPPGLRLWRIVGLWPSLACWFCEARRTYVGLAFGNDDLSGFGLMYPVCRVCMPIIASGGITTVDVGRERGVC